MADSIVDKVVNHRHLGNGSIILMHNGAKYTPQALEAVITGLQEKGYELVPISQLICKEQFSIDHEGVRFRLKRQFSKNFSTKTPFFVCFKTPRWQKARKMGIK